MKRHSILITGGAGFIGVNAARHFLKKGWNVTVFDNFSRRGTKTNTALLKREFRRGLRVVKGDVVTDFKKLQRETKGKDAVLHLAAQVAVTTSIKDPRADIEANLLGTFNVLEAIRLLRVRPVMLYASTNKVYGALEHLRVVSVGDRYRFVSQQHARWGVAESEQLDFHSPYGCSKGGADQYVIDYSRIYGLRTVVFRQSCVYGPYQFGIEDQGWLAWFTIATLLDKPLTIYGTGKQVRDVLYVEDLVRLYELAIKRISKVNGKAYNIGGGPAHTLSLKELFELLQARLGKKIQYSRAPVRAGDQPIFVADLRKIRRDLGWKPRINIERGWREMHAWMEHNKKEIKEILS